MPIAKSDVYLGSCAAIKLIIRMTPLSPPANTETALLALLGI